METFGIIDVLQKRLQAGLSLLEGSILMQIHFFPLHGLEEAFCECILGWPARSGHADGGSDIEQALHIHITTVLSSPIRVMTHPGGALTLSPCHLQRLQR